MTTDTLLAKYVAATATPADNLECQLCLRASMARIKRMTNQARKFGLHLECCGPGGESRASRLGVEPNELEAMRIQFTGLVSREQSRISLIETLGSPLVNEDRYARYDLTVRPGYLFEFRWSASGESLEDSGYVAQRPRQLEIGPPTTPEAVCQLRKYLERIGATSGELLVALGEPTERMGWWPIENWSYPHGLDLELRLGIVEHARS